MRVIELRVSGEMRVVLIVCGCDEEKICVQVVW